MFNGNDTAIETRIPSGRWTVIARDGKIDADGMGTVKGGSTVVAPTSALILARTR